MRFASLSLLALLPGALGGLVPLLYDGHPDAIADQYIIVFKPGIAHELIDAVEKLVAGVTDAVLGHAIDLPGMRARTARIPASWMKILRLRDDTIEYIAQSLTISAFQPISPSPASEVEASLIAKRAEQINAPWGLVRISGREKIADRPADKRTTYSYDSSRASSPYYAYVVDTGIRTDHVEFAGRAEWGKSYFTTPDPDCSGILKLLNPIQCIVQGGKGQPILEDDNGHGTHCAGIIGGASTGVAKAARLIAVKVLSSEGKGTTSDIIAGLDWIYRDALANLRVDKSVVNMSLGGGRYQPFNDAVESLVRSGVVVVVAAGNENADAANTSPASAPSAITVGASDIDDQRAGFSNFGPVVDIFAPGVDILSSINSSPGSYARLSGTSMAAPHVAGLVCYLRGVFSLPTPDNVATKIRELATFGKLTLNVGGTQNLLAYNGYLG